MTLTKEEIRSLGFILSPVSFSEEEYKRFEDIMECFYHASLSFCESATFYFLSEDMRYLSKVLNIEMEKGKENSKEIYRRILKKVEKELEKRGMIEQDNATCTTHST